MPPRPQLSRELIVATAHAMIVENGLDAVSLRGVAAKLGVTAPALYAYVDDKVDLFRGVAELEFTRLLRTFESIEAATPIERVRRQAVAYVEHALSDAALFQVMFLFRPDFVQQPHVDELPAATQVFSIAAAPIEAAMLDGSLRHGDPLLVAVTMWAAAHGAASVLSAGLHFGEDDQRRVIDSVIDNLLRGLAAPVE